MNTTSTNSWPSGARLVRASFLSLREREFAEAARALGNADGRIIFRHLLPNCLTPLVTFTPFAVVGAIFALTGLDFSLTAIAALLTLVGYSVNDTIVVFDRIRENSRLLRKLEFEKLVNHSIVQTLQRSINTQLMTVEFLLLALAMFGGITLREFSVILLVGLLSGTYSSIFFAAPILVVWENKEWRNWFGRGKKKPDEASASL